MRDHELFQKPFAIPVDQTEAVATPSAWSKTIAAKTVAVLPLLKEGGKVRMPGWCVYDSILSDSPEIEILCGGINSKQASAASIWRQGNLMHFGFDPDPSQLNETGQHLLLNSIAYIRRFPADRPIGRTPSVFLGEKIWPARKPDADLKQLGLEPAAATFLPQAIAAMAGKNSTAARRVLRRYAPLAPGEGDSVAWWRRFWQENQDYLYYSKTDGDRWYLDSLAQARQVPTAKLRGPARAGGAHRATDADAEGPADPGKPGKADHRAASGPVKVSARLLPHATDKALAVFELRVRLEPTWHIYPLAPLPQGSPFTPTEIDLDLPEGMSFVGDWVQPKPVVSPDDPKVKYFEGEPVFRRAIRMAGWKGSGVLRCKITYGVCDPRVCFPPNDLTVKVAPEIRIRKR